MRLEVDIGLTLRSPRRSFSLSVAFATSDSRVAVFGPSGAGKSITIQAIAGLIRPDRGRICVGDRLLFDAQAGICVPAREREIGYVFQDYALFPHLTVEENVGFPFRRPFSRKMPPAARRRIREVMSLFEIEQLADSMPSDLSGGQRQRTALARALASEPKVLLLDEPFAALDLALRKRLREELARLQERFAVPMVVITHDVDDVKVFGQTLVVYVQGQVRSVVPRRLLSEREGEKHAWLQVLTACGLEGGTAPA